MATRRKPAAKPIRPRKSSGSPRAAATTPRTTDAAPRFGGIGDRAVLDATAAGWSTWLRRLDRAGAKRWKHREIALYLREHYDIGDWWCQMVAVGFEQARGLRAPHQKVDGFSASASRTFAVPLARLYETWADVKQRRRWLDAKGYFIRKATENRSLRITWGDGTSVEVYFTEKGKAKSQLQVQQNKLPDAPAVMRSKSYWKAQFERLRELLG